MDIESISEQVEDESTRETRARFFKRLGKTAAIGLGFSLLSAAPAYAVTFTCCPPNDQHPCIPDPGCFPNLQCQWCEPTGGGGGCYICETTHTGCYTTPCCPC